MNDALKQQGRALENQFFAQVDQQLLNKLKMELERLPQRDALAEVSNIRNPQVLDKLLELGIDATAFAALTYVPLAAVAWADGSLDDAERNAILQAAEQHGAKEGSPSYLLLEKWLRRPPEPEVLQAWKDYVAELRKSADPAWFTSLKAEVIDQAEAIAEASGGILGLMQKVSAAEQRKLAELRKAFDG